MNDCAYPYYQFTAKVPDNIEELLFLFWVENEGMKYALRNRDEKFISFCDSIKGSVRTFIGDLRWPSECFELEDNNFIIPVEIFEGSEDDESGDLNMSKIEEVVAVLKENYPDYFIITDLYDGRPFINFEGTCLWKDGDGNASNVDELLVYCCNIISTFERTLTR